MARLTLNERILNKIRILINESPDVYLNTGCFDSLKFLIFPSFQSHNQLMVTHLLLPKQTGTSDSCTTDNEEDLFTYQDKYDLITLGWIHVSSPLNMP